MNKGIVLGMVILVIGMSFTGTTISLSMSKSQILTFEGNRFNVGGNGTGNYSKIQYAIDNASDGDFIFVYDDSSPYYENLVVDKSIILQGENRDTTIIDGNYLNPVLRIKADHVAVLQFTIQHGRKYSGIRIDAEDCTILHNIIKDNDGRGIGFGHTSKDCNVYKNIILNNDGKGILSLRVDGLHIFNNTIRKNNDHGIDFKGGNGHTILLNDITDNNGHGISLTDCVDSHIIDNNICNNSYHGIDLYHSVYGDCSRDNDIMGNYVGYNGYIGIKVRSHSSNNTIMDNTVFNCGETGIEIEDYAIDNDVVFNSCFKNEYGIVVSGYSCNNTFKHNRLYKNVGGALVCAYCENNSFFGNIFSNNRFGLQFAQLRSWNNTIKNNCFKKNWVALRFDDSSLNKICKNDFIENFFMVESFGSHNYWNRNYWGRPRLLPKLIFGREWNGNRLIPILDGIDWRPAKEPYDITTAQGCGIV